MDLLMAIVSIVGVVAAILVAVIGDSGVITFLNKADVRCLRTQDLRRSREVVQGVILVNRGRKAANETAIKLLYDGSTILDVNIEEGGLLKKPNIDRGGVGENFVVISLPSFPPQTKVAICVTRVEGGEKLKVNGYFDGNPILEDSNSYSRPLTDKVALFLFLLASFWMILGIFFP